MEITAVVKRIGAGESYRKGRGFSLPEIKEAELTPRDALKLGIMIDKRRKSKHAANIDALKKLAEEKLPKKAPEKKKKKSSAKKGRKKSKKEK